MGVETQERTAMTQPFDTGDRVQITTPESADPDHHHHRRLGQVLDVREDGYAVATGDPRDAYLYRIRFIDDDGGEMWFRHADLCDVE